MEDSSRKLPKDIHRPLVRVFFWPLAAPRSRPRLLCLPATANSNIQWRDSFVVYIFLVSSYQVFSLCLPSTLDARQHVPVTWFGIQAQAMSPGERGKLRSGSTRYKAIFDSGRAASKCEEFEGRKEVFASAHSLPYLPVALVIHTEYLGYPYSSSSASKA